LAAKKVMNKKIKHVPFIFFLKMYQICFNYFFVKCG